jgi:3-oxoacyl-[acyl-carrier-protein] synthase II
MSTRNDEPQRASRPFDRDRDGFVMAEGAAVLVLERWSDALARGAHIYGEIAGYGTSNDAYHMSAPLPDGTQAARPIRHALREAQLAPDEVEALNAHGSGTPLGDRSERLALRGAFGDALARIPVTATKGQHGHALGATGAWEAALSLLAIERGTIPGLVNFENSDPECGLVLSRGHRASAPRTVVSFSAGFGGINAALVLRGAT